MLRAVAMNDKHSMHELKRLVEAAVAEACDLPRRGLWFCVDAVDTVGRPPHRLAVSATLHFLPEGSPFCCGEPGCYLGLYGKRLEQVGDSMRRRLGLRQAVTVEFPDGIRVEYHTGVTFDYGMTED